MAKSDKRFYVQNVDAWENNLSRKRFFGRKLEVKVIERGIILPARKVDGIWQGGVCDSDFNFVAGFSRRENNAGGGFAVVNMSYAVKPEEIVQLEEEVIFGGALIGHFGHFMLECWSRLWFIIQNPGLRSKILFITTTHGGYHAWFDDFFRLMGIDKARIIYVKQPTQCRSVTVPEQAQYSPTSFAKEFFLPYQAIKARVTPGKPKKIYLTRAEYEGDKNIGVHCYNEKYFEDFFSARGFEIVAPEKLSVAEQISLIMGAEEIAATLGTLTHWAIFCKPDTKFIMLNRTEEHVSKEQCLINQAFKIKNFYIVDVSKNFMYANRTVGAILLGSTKYWKAFVADYFGETIDADDDNLYLEEALDKYVDFWCEKYFDDKEVLRDSLKNMCRLIESLRAQVNKNRPLLSYRTHVAVKGWSDGWKSESQLSNPLDQKLDVQAVKIDFPSHKVYYSVYDSEGWSEEVIAPEMAGTTGKSKPITGIKIRLDESGAKDFDICYRVHKFDGTWTDWAKNGEAIYSHGQKLNSIQITLKPKSDSPPLEK